MNFDELREAWDNAWARSDEAAEDDSVTIAINTLGHFHIEDVVYCDHCKEYHIQLGKKSDRA